MADSYNSIQDDGSLHFVCWTNVLENEFFTAAANIIIKHLNREFPKITRTPGPFAFSETKYVKKILKASGFENIKVNKVYTSLSTNDDAEKDGELLFNIGLAGRLLAEESPEQPEMTEGTYVLPASDPPALPGPYHQRETQMQEPSPSE